jgi:hypothetical protein
MPSVGHSPPPAVSATRQRLVSALVEEFSEWWQLPAVVLAALALAAIVLWTYRRDAAELPWPARLTLAGLRLGAIAVVAIALLDLQRTTEREFVLPSRVAVLVDASASMSLSATPTTPAGATDPAASGAADASRAGSAADVLDGAGLLAALARRHEVSVWRFEADAERLVTLPQGATAAAGEAGTFAAAEPAAEEDRAWRQRLRPQGYETRLGEALAAVLDQEPRGLLAGIVVLTDGANNAGVDPLAAAGACAAAGVAIHPVGFGSDRLPENVRVADVAAPARVVPGDGFAVTAYLQAQGLERKSVSVELLETAANDPAAGAAVPAGSARSIAIRDVPLGPDGEIVPVRFDVPGLATAGRRTLTIRVRPPAEDRTPADDAQGVDVDVVERLTQVLLVAGGPTREYQFARSVLHRDKSFAVDVLLGTAAPGISQDARRLLERFPDSDAALGGYDLIMAFDYDWRLLDAAGQARLERWVARESGGIIFVSGAVSTDRWQAADEAATVRGLLPVETGSALRPGDGQPIVGPEPMPLAFTREGEAAEFLWLAPTAAASRTIWEEFRGVHACFGAGAAKPGATVYARVVTPSAGADARPIFLAGQYYGSGSTFLVASGELWRLRGIGDAVYERLVAQLARHVAQGRLLRGSSRGRLLVDRDRFPVGGSVAVRVVLAEPGNADARPRCRAIAPDGTVVAVPLEAEPTRPGMLRGGFVASREGAWQIDCDLGLGDDARLTHRIQAQLPDRELARPRLDRGLLEQVARAAGGEAAFPGSAAWTAADSDRLAAAIPDRSRREYETAAADAAFKRRLNGVLLSAGVGLLCLEWITRRLLRLA